jgi:hypothetical protein
LEENGNNLYLSEKQTKLVNNLLHAIPTLLYDQREADMMGNDQRAHDAEKEIMNLYSEAIEMLKSMLPSVKPPRTMEEIMEMPPAAIRIKKIPLELFELHTQLSELNNMINTLYEFSNLVINTKSESSEYNVLQQRMASVLPFFEYKVKLFKFEYQNVARNIKENFRTVWTRISKLDTDLNLSIDELITINKHLNVNNITDKTNILRLYEISKRMEETFREFVYAIISLTYR